MTVAVGDVRVSYTGNGATTAFDFPNKFFQNADLKVYVGDDLKVLTTDYTVSGAGAVDGGTVTFLSAPANSSVVLLINSPLILQDKAYAEGDDFPAASHEEALDRLTKISQRLEDRLNRTASLSDTSTNTPPADGYLDQVVEDVETAAEEAGDSAAGAATSATNAAASEAAAAAAAASIGTAVSDAAASATAAASSASAASTSASAASTSASSASTSASSATSSASSATSSASSASTSASSASASLTKLTGVASTTSLAIATGSKSFTVADATIFTVGNYAIATSDADPTTNNMYGQITSASGTTLTINVTVIGGSGTKADWTIRLSGARGATGATGAAGLGSGDMLAANNLSELTATASTARANIGLVIDTNVQSYSAKTAAIVALTWAADKLAYFTSSSAAAVTDLTSVARTLIGQTTQALMRTTGLGSTTVGDAVFIAANAAAARTAIGAVIGTDVQAQDAELAALAGLTSAANKGIQFTGSGTAATYDLTAAGKALLDDADAAAQRTTLGLGTGSLLVTDTDGTLAANSDSNVPTQKAVKTYVAANAGAPVAGNGISVSGSTVSINTNNSLGVGATALCVYTGTPAVANAATTAGTNLQTAVFNSTNANAAPPIAQIIFAGAGLSGTWRNISGQTLTNAANDTGLFIRTA